MEERQQTDRDESIVGHRDHRRDAVHDAESPCEVQEHAAGRPCRREQRLTPKVRADLRPDRLEVANRILAAERRKRLHDRLPHRAQILLAGVFGGDENFVGPGSVVCCDHRDALQT